MVCVIQSVLLCICFFGSSKSVTFYWISQIVHSWIKLAFFSLRFRFFFLSHFLLFNFTLDPFQLMLYEAFMNSNEGRVLLKSINVKREDDDDADSLPVTYGAVRHGFQALRYLQAVCNHPCLALKPTHPILADVKRVLHAEYGARVSLDSVYLSGKLLALW